MTTFSIENIIGREIIDSRGNPTLEVFMTFANNIQANASVPSGASVGIFEAVELRDCDLDRYNGMGVKKCIRILETEIKPLLIGKKFHSLKEFDDFIIQLDGTHNKSKIGSNTSLALSLAFTKCMSLALNIPMFRVIFNEYQTQYGAIKIQAPTPMLNLINGGKHASNQLVMQEFMVVPIMNTSIHEKIRLSCEFFFDLRDSLRVSGHSTNVGDEGGFAPMLSSGHDALDMIMNVLSKSKYEKNFRIAIDAAASTFYDHKTQTYALYEDDEPIKYTDTIDYYEQLVNEYPIISIEDPMAEEDIVGWKKITERLSKKIMLIGDDLFVTNTRNLQHGIDNGLANAILIKPNQIGTITETMQAVNLARQNRYDVIVSHRSGETEDVSLSHLAVGLGASYIKAGAPCRSERVAKYNELMRIFSDEN